MWFGESKIFPISWHFCSSGVIVEHFMPTPASFIAFNRICYLI